MATTRFSSVLLIVILIMFSGYCLFAGDEGSAAGQLVYYRERIAELEDENETLKELLNGSRASLAHSQDGHISENHSEKREPECNKDSSALRFDQEVRRYRIGKRVKEIEKHVAITPVQREALMKLLEQYDSNAQAAEALRDILGEEVYADYMTAMRAEREQHQDEIIEQRLYTLNRKLSLTPEQEEAVLQTMHDLEEGRLSGRRSFSGAGEKRPSRSLLEGLRQVEDRRERRKLLFNEQLRTILTDEQYNKLLEYQETSRHAQRVFGF